MLPIHREWVAIFSLWSDQALFSSRLNDDTVRPSLPSCEFPMLGRIFESIKNRALDLHWSAWSFLVKTKAPDRREAKPLICHEDPAALARFLWRQGGTSAIATPSVRARINNRELLLPVIFNALDGDEESQRFYEQHRLFQYNALPDWAQRETTNLLRGALARFNFRLLVPKDIRKDRRTLELAEEISTWAFRSNLILALNLNALATYDRFCTFINTFNNFSYDQEMDWDGEPEEVLQQAGFFSPANRCPLGRHALSVLREVVPHMFRMHLVADFLNALEIPLEDSTFLEIARKPCQSPWGVLQSREVKNLVAIKRYLETHKLELTRSEHEKLNAHFYRTSRIQAQLAQQFSTAPTTGPTNESPIAAEVTELSPTREVILNGLFEAVRDNHPGLADPRSIARRLFRICKKSGQSYLRVLNALEAKQDPFDIMEDLYVESLRSSDIEPASEPKAARAQELLISVVETSEPREHSIVHIDRALISVQLEALGHNGKQRVLARLYRMSQGNFGVTARISGGISEAKISQSPGYRIYFASEPERTIILGIGVKDTQQTDIEAARDRLKKFRQAGSKR